MDNNTEVQEEKIEVPSVTQEQSNSTAPPQAQTTKPVEKSDWEKFEDMASDSHDYIETPYEQKAWLLTTRFKDKPVMDLRDLVLKELATAFIQDPEQALIYSIKMDCVEEWLSLDFHDLAKSRLVHMLFRLYLSKSIGGIENIAQHGTSSIGMSLDREDHERQPLEQQNYGDNQQQQQGGAQRFSVSNLLRKWKK